MNKTKVFSVKYQTDSFVDWFGYSWQQNNFDWTENFDEILNQNIKIAAVPVFFDQFQQYQNNPFDYKLFDIILISDIEANYPEVIKSWIKSLGIKNYLIAYGCKVPYQLEKDTVYRPWWAFNIIDRNSFQTIDASPQYDYDVLLGAKKPHRDFIMANMQSSGLLENSIVNYLDVFTAPDQPYSSYEFKVGKHIDKILSGQKLIYPYYSTNMKPEWEVRENIDKSVSDQVPWKIYEQTKYSIVAETLDDPAIFLTEKTGKCLYSKRMFIVFGGPGHLKLLHQLGFKTFPEVIDESYDTIENSIERWQSAWNQVVILSHLNYQKVKSIIQPILEHNHKRLIEYRKEIKQQMLQMVYNKIEEIKC